MTTTRDLWVAVARDSCVDRHRSTEIKHQSDHQLVLALMDGSMASLAELYTRHRADAYHTALRVLRCPHEAADVVQSCFIRARTRIRQLRDPERFRPWLLRIVHNEALAQCRRRARTVLQPVAKEAAIIDAEDHDPVDLAGIQNLIEDAAGALVRRDRMAIGYALNEGGDAAMHAQLCGVSRHNAYVIMHRARSRLRLALIGVVAIRSPRDCDGLELIAAAWDQTYSRSVHRKVIAHLRSCPRCHSLLKCDLRELTSAARVAPPGQRSCDISDGSGRRPPLRRSTDRRATIDPPSSRYA